MFTIFWVTWMDFHSTVFCCFANQAVWHRNNVQLFFQQILFCWISELGSVYWITFLDVLQHDVCRYNFIHIKKRKTSDGSRCFYAFSLPIMPASYQSRSWVNDINYVRCRWKVDNSADRFSSFVRDLGQYRSFTVKGGKTSIWIIVYRAP